MLIATAGHIDHGKTSLVRALTGVETDSLPEEKARGISIDLGFAYWRPDGDAGETIGFVDVPGHERFVRTMVAGVGGVDLALLVVAADDGAMPQTVEHLRIIDLLGIDRGMVALTKCDRAAPERVAEVRAEVAKLLAGTCLAAAPLFEISALTGSGVASLAEALRAEARRPRQAADGAFRMAVDRCFGVTGAGTVATGTVLAGTLATGNSLILSPAGTTVRVRGLHSAGRPADNVGPGQRCAVNLAGIELGEVHRGDWLLAPAMHAPTARIEARVRLLAECAAPLRHGAGVQLHIGAAAIPARVLSRRQTPVLPGEHAIVTLALERPTSAVGGERFVLRDPARRALIGGGRVVDPFAPARQRPDARRAAVLAALELHDPAACLAALLAIDGFEVVSTWFERCFNLLPEPARAHYSGAGSALAGRDRSLVVPSARLALVGDAVITMLAGFHRDQPHEGGLPPREIRARLALPVSADLLGTLLRDLAGRERIAFTGSLARLPGHSASFSAAETALWRALLAWLEEQPPRTVTAAELTPELRAGEAAIRAMLHRRRAHGDVWAIDGSRFMLREHVARLAASAAALATRHGGMFSAAQFRDATGIGRNHVIRLLEFFDRIGVSARRGEARIVRRDYESVAGNAQPYWGAARLGRGPIA